jgi:hypothetical protein
MFKKNFSFVPVIFFMMAEFALSQSSVDALRYSQLGLNTGARSAAMGGAYTGIADDYSAVIFNPAGLGQIKRFEFTGGININGNNDNATYLGQSISSSNNVTSLDNLGLVVPLPTFQGSLVIAGGFSRTQNFNASASLDAVNPTNSITQAFANSSFYNSTAYSVYAVDSLNGKLVGQFPNGNVHQTSKILEDGGTNTFSLAGAIEVEQGLFVGATLNFLSGSYAYTRDFTETAISGTQALYPSPYGATAVNLNEFVNTDISGFNAKIGFLYRVDEHLRVGLTAQTPTFYSFKDTYNSTVTTYFPSNNPYPYPYNKYTNDLNSGNGNSQFDYDLSTPFVFTGGLSYEYLFVTVAADAKYTDWTQMQFTSPSGAFQDVNQNIKNDFQPTLDYHVGAEVRIPKTTLRLRAGYAYEPSPYKYQLANPTAKTTSDDAHKSLSFGGGFLLRRTLSIDVAYTASSYRDEQNVYDGSPVLNEKITTSNLLVTFSYRF